MRRTSDIEARLGNGDPGRADSQAPWTVPVLGGKASRTDEKIGETQIVHKHRAQYAGESQQTLIDPGQLASPCRGVPIVRPNRIRSERDRADRLAAIV